MLLSLHYFRYDKGRTGSATGQSGLKLLAVTLKLLKEKRQLLILPITIFIGAEQAFLFADYNAVSKIEFLFRMSFERFQNLVIYC